MEVKDPIDPNLPPEPETGELLLQRVVRDIQNLDNNSALTDLGHDEAVLPDQLMSTNQQFANQVLVIKSSCFSNYCIEVP